MDQSASILSSPESALYISFYPSLQVVPTPLPTSSETPAAFVIANSLAASHKAETGKFRYNLRVVETLVGARVLSRVLDINIGKDERLTYRQVLERWYQNQGKQDGEASLKDEILAILKGGHLEKLKGKELDGVTLEEMIQMTGMTPEDFHKVFLSWVEGKRFIPHFVNPLNQPLVEATHFQLYKRAVHVFTEALRVLQFRDLCMDSRGSSTSPEEVLVKLGKLMDESQDSCANLFECSCPELDKLTAVAKSLGAYGSRLTGLFLTNAPNPFILTKNVFRRGMGRLYGFACQGGRCRRIYCSAERRICTLSGVRCTLVCISLLRNQAS